MKSTLRLHHGHVAMRAALEHELAPDGAQILQLPGVDPDVDGQHGRQRGMISSADQPCAAG